MFWEQGDNYDLNLNYTKWPIPFAPNACSNIRGIALMKVAPSSGHCNHHHTQFHHNQTNMITLTVKAPCYKQDSSRQNMTVQIITFKKGIIKSKDIQGFIQLER